MGILAGVIFFLFLGFTDSRLEYNPDTHLPTPQLVVKNGYPIETHTLLTKDGYFLTLHRIPFGQKNKSYPRQPVIVQHGIMCSSADWVILGPGKAIAYLLADAGYDVWLGNARGNTYSRNHVKYTTKSSSFWNFSFHEMGVFDLPTVIDYILKETGHQKLKYIAHSMGVTMFLVLLSEHPEYNEKISAAAALAPVAYLVHAPTPLRDFLVTRGTETLLNILKKMGRFDFFPSSEPVIEIGRDLCRDIIFNKLVCENILYIIGGFDTTQLNESFVPVILGHTPAGTSLKVIHHYSQYMRNERFCKYDYGKDKNKIVYGTAQPPLYKLNNVKVPISLFYSDHDALAPRTDVVSLYKQLPNVVGMFRVPLSKFNHLDFLWGNDVKTLLYDDVLKFLNKL